MNYEIKIQGAEEANGTINLNRLAQLAASCLIQSGSASV